MIRVNVDRNSCQGYGNCVLALPSAFDIDDEGLVVLKEPNVDEENLNALRSAAYDCPTDSISYQEDSG